MSPNGTCPDHCMPNPCHVCAEFAQRDATIAELRRDVDRLTVERDAAREAAASLIDEALRRHGFRPPTPAAHVQATRMPGDGTFAAGPFDVWPDGSGWSVRWAGHDAGHFGLTLDRAVGSLRSSMSTEWRAIRHLLPGVESE